MSHPGTEGDASRDLGGDEVIYPHPAERKRGNRPTPPVNTEGRGNHYQRSG